MKALRHPDLRAMAVRMESGHGADHKIECAAILTGCASQHPPSRCWASSDRDRKACLDHLPAELCRVIDERRSTMGPGLRKESMITELTPEEARRALYIDFEGQKDQPPVLLGCTRRS